MTTTSTELGGVMIGGYWHAFTSTRTAGRFGCDPCFRCSRRPAEGESVRFTCYGDLFCSTCAAIPPGPFTVTSRHDGRYTGSTSFVATLSRALELARSEVDGDWTSTDEAVISDGADRFVARFANIWKRSDRALTEGSRNDGR